jgi:fluoroquinolone transport system ATP-binding protein
MIDVDGLTFTYPGADAPAIEGLTFRVAEGEVFGFLGPSGAGKSTTQNVLIGLLTGYRGSVRVMGKRLGDWASEYYRAIGVSFELPNHYLKLTARENLEYFRALYGDAEKVETVLGFVGLEDHVDKPVGAFSKGMKNRLNLARSLLHRPKLWFLDEPTAGLDPVNAVAVRELIRDKQKQGVTTLVTTHDMHTAQTVCDRVAFIIDGTFATIGAPDDLRREHGKREVEVRWEGDDETPSGTSSHSLDGLADDEAFRDALRKPNVSAVHSQEATLEDVFVAVTGRELK